jgi:hypothetical protein
MNARRTWVRLIATGFVLWGLLFFAETGWNYFQGEGVEWLNIGWGVVLLWSGEALYRLRRWGRRISRLILAGILFLNISAGILPFFVKGFEGTLRVFTYELALHTPFQALALLAVINLPALAGLIFLSQGATRQLFEQPQEPEKSIYEEIA